MYCGIAVNAALYLGLDKMEDEVLFGYRKAKYSLSNSDPKYRRMTWLKCFQISTQLSSWHGLRSCPVPCLQDLSSFYDEETMPGDFVPLTEIQRQVARYTTTLDGPESSGLTMTMTPHFLQDLDSIKMRYSMRWSPSAEINLQAAKLYLLSICLLATDEQSLQSLNDSDTGIFLHKALQWGHAAALSVVDLVVEMGASSIDNAPCSAHDSNACALLAHPKQHFVIAFFACIFLLKYIDCNRAASAADMDAARNAVSRTYELFKRFPCVAQKVRAARTIELLGRTIVPDRGRMVTHVKSRMGASLVYNAIWTASELRGRMNDPEWSTSAATTPQVIQDSPISTSTALPAPTIHESYSVAGLDASSSSFDISSQPLPQNFPFEQQFPWGIWSDSLFDALYFDRVVQPYSDSIMPMYNL